jgi:hypothetical protein
MSKGSTLLMGVGAALILGCGGSIATVDGTARPDGGAVDSGLAVSTDASTSDDLSIPPEAGTGCSTVRVPKDHRASVVACPTARGAGNAAKLDASPPPGCNQDSECTMGQNGRCLLNGWGFTAACSYDDCYADSECPGNVACVCRESANDSLPNVCALGSGCRIDSDCGPCGYCSPSGNPFFRRIESFCHTAGDTCTDDSDCQSNPGSCQQGCNFDPQAGHWSCVAECPP